MEVKRLREVYVIFLGLCARANLEIRELMEPGKIPAEEEILAGRGGRPGRRPWAAGEAAAGRPGGRLGGSGSPPGEAEFPSQGPPWGGPR